MVFLGFIVGLSYEIEYGQYEIIYDTSMKSKKLQTLMFVQKRINN